MNSSLSNNVLRGEVALWQLQRLCVASCMHRVSNYCPVWRSLPCHWIQLIRSWFDFWSIFYVVVPYREMWLVWITSRDVH